MAGNTNYATDVARADIEGVLKGVVDQTLRQNPLTDLIVKRGNVVPMSGSKITLGSIHGLNTNFQWVNENGNVKLDQQDYMDRPEWDWAKLSIGISFKKFNLMQNSGPEQVIDILKSGIEITNLTFAQKFEDSLLSDGSAGEGVDGAPQIAGLATAVEDGTAWGTYGNINRALAGNEYWRNKYTASSNGLGHTSAMSIWLKFFASLGGDSDVDSPDLILCGPSTWSYLADNKILNKYVVDAPKSKSGSVANIATERMFYRGAEVRFISNNYFPSGADTTAANPYTPGGTIEHLLFLNTRYFTFVPLRGFSKGLLIEKLDIIPGAFLKGAQGFYACQLVCKAPAKQGRLSYASLTTS